MKLITVEQIRNYTSDKMPDCPPEYSEFLEGIPVEQQLRFFSVKIVDGFLRYDNIDFGEERLEIDEETVALTECPKIECCVVDQNIIVGAIYKYGISSYLLTVSGKPALLAGSEVHDFDPSCGFSYEKSWLTASLLFSPEGIECE